MSDSWMSSWRICIAFDISALWKPTRGKKIRVVAFHSEEEHGDIAVLPDRGQILTVGSFLASLLSQSR